MCNNGKYNLSSWMSPQGVFYYNIEYITDDDSYAIASFSSDEFNCDLDKQRLILLQLISNLNKLQQKLDSSEREQEREIHRQQVINSRNQRYLHMVDQFDA